MSDERIMTLHPDKKQGVNILKRKYETIKDFILTTLGNHERLSYKELNRLAKERLSDSFDGKVTWYIVTVKLDLEARELIKRVPGTSPHELKLSK